MAFLSDTHVKVTKAIVTWDGLSDPSKNDDGSVDHNLGFAISNSAPEKAELDKIVQDAINNDSVFRGTLPAGANQALKEADTQKFGPLLTNHSVGNASTRRGCPPIFDEQGNQLSADQLRGVLYAGCEVVLLVHAFTYNNKQKGAKFGLDGVQIINRNAEKLPVAAGMSVGQVASAFGINSVMSDAPQAAAPAPQAAAPAPQAAAPAPPKPANDLASGKIMLPAAQGIPYQAYIDQGWTDEQLIANGLMQG